MENKYTADQIASICKVSKQSIYSLIKKNKDFINDNSIRNHRVVYYNQTAMDFFISYYLPEEAPENRENQPDKDDIATVSSISENLAEMRGPEGEQKSPVEVLRADEPPEDQSEALRRKIDALEAEIEALRKQLDASEEERRELLRQNGAILLVLQQEKQEKQLFLPAPKKTLSEKVKALFHKGS